MKRWIAVILMAAMASGAWAGGWSVTFPLGADGTVGLTNSQGNSSWAPVAALWKFTSAGTGTAEVWRVSQGASFVLSNCVFTNVTTVVWVPDAQYPFALGDALMLWSSVTNGVVQVIRKGE